MLFPNIHCDQSYPNAIHMKYQPNIGFDGYIPILCVVYTWEIHFPNVIPTYIVISKIFPVTVLSNFQKSDTCSDDCEMYKCS